MSLEELVNKASIEKQPIKMSKQISQQINSLITKKPSKKSSDFNLKSYLRKWSPPSLILSFCIKVMLQYILKDSL